MTPDQFAENMKRRHEEAIADFGVPDKLILSEDVKLWRVTGAITKVFGYESFSWPEIVPVKSGNKVVGAASIFPKGDFLVASATCTYDLPERLDFENGTPLTLVPVLDTELQVTAEHIRWRIVSLEFGTVDSKDAGYEISTWESV